MTRLTIPVLRPVNGSGEPEPGSTLTFYDAGASSVLKTVYSDSALTVSLGSTVTSDGEGLFVDIYYSGDIRLVWANSQGTILLTRDLYGAGNITAGDLATDSVTTIKIVNGNVTLAKIETLDNAKIITSNGSANSQVSISGDATMSNTGVLTLTNPASRIWKSSTVGGTANAITAVSSPVITALVDGMIYVLNPVSSNTTATPTFAPDGLTARTIVNNSGTLKEGDIQAGKFAVMIYDLTNTRWILINPAYGAKSTVAAPAAQSYASSTDYTFAHGLLSTPTFVSVYMTCTTNDGNFTAGETVIVAPFGDFGGGAADYGFGMKVDATNITIYVAKNGILLVDSANDHVAPTNASWNIGVRCFY